jgi:Leucine-rich repeat (LRR) protein
MPHMKNLEIIKERIKKVVDNKLLYLDLSCLNITEIPKELFELNEIYEIDLSYNNINTIPDSLLELKKIQKLNFSFNYIYELNFKFANNYSLVEIDISHNNFYSPPNIEYLETEIFINYRNNPFVNTLPEEIADMDLNSIS